MAGRRKHAVNQDCLDCGKSYRAYSALAERCLGCRTARRRMLSAQWKRDFPARAAEHRATFERRLKERREQDRALTLAPREEVPTAHNLAVRMLLIGPHRR